ncbi:hypothetical protein tb265_17220 [Gemmatimonadetes bacterium T265]|nr:hypothetical protein tb265_17220 [Gemmatimonadetes bacterium T265]
MPDLSGLPYAEIAFDHDGTPVDPGQVDDALDAAAAPNSPADDVVVVSHGWNDSADEARALYAGFGANFAPALTANGVLPGRRVVVVGLLWPSKEFADPRLVPTDAVIHGQLDRVEALSGADLSLARAQVPRLRASPAARRAFIDDVLAILPPTATQEEAQPAHVVQVSGDPQFLERLGTPLVAPPAAPRGGAADAIGDRPIDDRQSPAPDLPPGAALGIGGWLAGVEVGAVSLLNYTTYYLMKDRAARVGRAGLAPVLARLRAALPNTATHLVGHSFGARLVTAAAADAAVDAVDSLSLLQAAFSHYAFARGWDDGATRDGFFRAVVAAPAPRVRGPTLVTFTRNDHAVGVAYAIASRVAGQIASAVGDAHDPYGALGANGAQKTPEATVLRLIADGAPYAFAPGAVYNLDGNGTPGDPGVITGHTDVRRPEVAHAVAEAVRAAAR